MEGDVTTSTLLARIERSDAISRARKFLEQHHSIINADAKMQGGQWIVTAQVGFLPTQTKQVRIDAKSGRILQCI